MIRDSARRQATLADEYCEETQAARACDDEDSAGNLFGMGLFAVGSDALLYGIVGGSPGLGSLFSPFCRG